MIKLIRGENIYNVLDTLVSITSLCEVYSRKPDEGSTPIGNYAYINIITDRPGINSNVGALGNTARISITIVCKETLGATDTEERVLYDIIDAINNAIVNEGCVKINNWDGFLINSIVEDTASPIFADEKNRAYIVKDYIFNYMIL